jgi:L-amino acid N-acyltransferase YncA
VSTAPARVSVRLASAQHELEQILALQQKNLEPTADGFVTVRHTLEVLAAMHARLPSVVALDEHGAVVGYALAMARESRALLPILAPMFERLDALPALAGRRWYVMGQVCVAEAWRGRGVLDALYADHRAAYADRFDALVTEIATRNRRSLAAHARVGFVELDRYRDATDEWSVVAWSW